MGNELGACAACITFSSPSCAMLMYENMVSSVKHMLHSYREWRFKCSRVSAAPLNESTDFASLLDSSVVYLGHNTSLSCAIYISCVVVQNITSPSEEQGVCLHLDRVRLPETVSSSPRTNSQMRE